MYMKLNRVIEYGFFFILLALSGYMVWLIAQPFISALALAAIIVTICNPLHSWILKKMPKRKSIAAFFTTIMALILVVIPVVFISSMVVTEVIGVYRQFDEGNDLSIEVNFTALEQMIQNVIPGFR